MFLPDSEDRTSVTVAEPTRALPRLVRRTLANRKSQLPRSATDVFIVALIVAGILCSWLAEILPVESGFRAQDTEGKIILMTVKTAAYYAAHALSVFCLIGAGVAAGLKNNFRNLTPEARVALPVLIVVSLFWAVSSYSVDELLSPAVFGATGPFVWLLLILVAGGAVPRVWQSLDWLIRALSYVTSALAFRALSLEPYAAFRGFSKYILYAMLLTWLGGWTLLTATRLTGWRLAVRLIPYLAAVLMALCSQSRSWTLLSLILGMIFVFLRGREQRSLTSVVRLFGGMCVAGLLIAVVASVASPETITRSWEGFQKRFGEDTRTGQYEAFFASVPPADLLLGRGPKGTWYWRGWGEYQFFDNGYLWTLFIGGVPTLLCFVTLLIWPGVRLLRRFPSGHDAAAVSLVLLYGVALTGLSTFTVPTLGLTGCLMALFAGRCHGLLSGFSRRGAAL